MAKKAVIGTSPKDSSMDKMDRYITRNEQKERENLRKYGTRKKDLSKIPFDEWPLDKQLEYMEKRTPNDRFDETYYSYGTWITAVRERSGVYHSTFGDWIRPIKDKLTEMYESKTWPKEAATILKKDYGIY